jgi:hypothetical protein
MKEQQKQKVLRLLNEANDILTDEIADDEEIETQDIFCPLGEVISNVYDIDTE